MPLYLVMSILIEQNLEIHPFQDLLNWDNFDTIHWTMDMRMMFEEDAFDHVEFILCIQFIGASKGSEARLYQWSFVNIVQATGAIGWVWVRQLQITRCPPVHWLATAYVPPCLLI